MIVSDQVQRCCITALLVLLLSACSSNKNRIDPPAELTPFDPVVQLEVMWVHKDGEIATTTDPLTLRVVDGHIYFGDGEGRVIALDQNSGEKLWSVNTDVELSAGVGYSDDLLLLGSHHGELLALNRNNGEEVWRSMLSSEVLSPPVESKGQIFTRTSDSKLFALDAASGKQHWTISQKVPVLSLRGESPLLVDEANVYAGFANGKMLAVSQKEGQILWEATIAIPEGRSELERMVDIDSAPLLGSEVIYVATFQGRVAAVGQFSGAVIWAHNISTFKNMAINETQLFITDEQSHLWALNQRGGASLWRQEKLHGRQLSAPVILDDYVVVSDYEGYIHLLSQKEGSFFSRYRVDKSGIFGDPVVADGVLYIVGKSGTLTALRLAD